MASLTIAQTTWYDIATPTNKKLLAIDFASEQVGYIVGEDSTMLKSTDGGLNWNQVNYSGITFYPGGEDILNVKFVSEQIGYVTTGPYGGLFKTTDGGSNWTALTAAGTICYNQAFYFSSEGNGFYGGSGCFQGEAIDQMSGGTFSSTTINSPSSLASDYVRDIDFRGNLGMAVSASRFLRSTDGGANWDTLSSGTMNPLTSIKIINDTLVYAGYIDESSSFGLMKSVDAGLTWGTETSMATFYYPDYHDVISADNGYLYSCGGSDFVTTGLIFEDKGQGWWYYDVDQTIYGMTNYKDSIVFGVGDSGYVVTNIDPQSLSINSNHENVELKVYPNPTESICFFEFSGINESTTLQLFDLQGRLIRSYSTMPYQISMQDLPDGVYIIHIEGDSFSTSERLIKKGGF